MIFALNVSCIENGESNPTASSLNSPVKYLTSANGPPLYSSLRSYLFSTLCKNDAIKTMSSVSPKIASSSKVNLRLNLAVLPYVVVSSWTIGLPSIRSVLVVLITVSAKF